MAITIPRHSWSAVMNPMKTAIAPLVARAARDRQPNAAAVNRAEERAKKKAEAIQ